MLIQEETIIHEKDVTYSGGESGLYEPFTQDLDQLFTFCEKEFGEFQSHICIDDKQETRCIGWVFSQELPYAPEDVKDGVTHYM